MWYLTYRDVVRYSACVLGGSAGNGGEVGGWIGFAGLGLGLGDWIWLLNGMLVDIGSSMASRSSVSRREQLCAALNWL